MKMRLDRWLATLSLGSRSEVREWIRGGKAAVNGRIIRDPALSFDTETAALSLNGKPVDGRVNRHVMLYKPAGVLTAARDPKQTTVMDLLPPVYRSIGCMPVGRLDKDTTGILIFTCDGELNHRLLSPGRHVEKCYRVIAEGRMGPQETALFAHGIHLSDFDAQPAKLEILSANSCLVTVQEGKYHQVRRMLAAAGNPVVTLRRLQIGALRLPDTSEPGAWRDLSEEEKAKVFL